jgi:hypothetical protein
MWGSSRVAEETVGSSISYVEGDNPSVSATFRQRPQNTVNKTKTLIVVGAVNWPD